MTSDDIVINAVGSAIQYFGESFESWRYFKHTRDAYGFSLQTHLVVSFPSKIQITPPENAFYTDSRYRPIAELAATLRGARTWREGGGATRGLRALPRE